MNTKLYGREALQQQETYQEVAQILLSGGVVIVPTETVYGLAADGKNSVAVGKIFAAKGRPQDNPLIMHIGSMEMLEDIVTEIPPLARRLAERFWPGPLTMILPKRDCVPEITSAGLASVAVRMPSHVVMQRLIAACNRPLAAPSANRSGRPSPTSFAHCTEDMMGRVDAILDGGDCAYGLESTVLDMQGEIPVLLRPGAITPEEILSVTKEIRISQGVTKELQEDEVALSPGLKHKHYAPNAKVTLIKGSFEKYCGYLEEHCTMGSYAMVFRGEGEKLSLPYVEYGAENRPLEQAHLLFDVLRQLDKLGAKEVYVRSPKEAGVGLAVYNRLLRAAAFDMMDLGE